MAFISNGSDFNLGEGVYNNVHGNLVHHTVHNHLYSSTKKRYRAAIESESESRAFGNSGDRLSNLLDGGVDASLLDDAPSSKRRRVDSGPEEGIKIIRPKNLKLTHQIGSGPGYFIHSGESKGRAVIVKVFNRNAGAREQLESTVELTRGLLHPNVLLIEGISSPASLCQFVAYRHTYWNNAESPLAAALKDNLARSVHLGLKLVEGLSAGINHLAVQRIPLHLIGPDNFDVFLDKDEQFVISINSSSSQDTQLSIYQSSIREADSNRAWDIFNGLSRRVLSTANRVLHKDAIERLPVDIDIIASPSFSGGFVPLSAPDSMLESSTSVDIESPISLRREYVWRTVSNERQSLGTVAAQIKSDLELKFRIRRRIARGDALNAHRCAGYVREEITLASNVADSAIITHNAPGPLEVCPICGQAVGFPKKFGCVCGDLTSGPHPTVQCQKCIVWSHVHCVGRSQEFVCSLCSSTGPEIPPSEPITSQPSRDMLRSPDIGGAVDNTDPFSEFPEWQMTAAETASTTEMPRSSFASSAPPGPSIEDMTDTEAPAAAWYPAPPPPSFNDDVVSEFFDFEPFESSMEPGISNSSFDNHKFAKMRAAPPLPNYNFVHNHISDISPNLSLWFPASTSSSPALAGPFLEYYVSMIVLIIYDSSLTVPLN
ncbi:hypothetical protein R3P38DRAFT_3275394 [Favolaschia claudopus]|uniref:Protein kinase domain-containing protein n=1 Tax=Favolaschia claudopus TaxID=2862362 RepID=A0AAW0AVX2_9AGAR